MEDRPEPETRLRATVHGRVQGVSFRYYAIREAERLGLTGWVANRWDARLFSTAAPPPRSYNRWTKYGKNLRVSLSTLGYDIYEA